MALVRLDKLTPERMSDEAAMQQWAQSLVDLLCQSLGREPKSRGNARYGNQCLRA